jgi:hypothetical protein
MAEVFCCGLRLISADEPTTDLSDSEDNVAFSHRPSAASYVLPESWPNGPVQAPL